MSIDHGKLGHNNGPSMATGVRFRKLCWGKARAQLLPKLPIEVIRRRVKRAGELGLDYKSYASIRATSGHDVVAFLFSSNALRLLKNNGTLPVDRVEKLKTLQRTGKLVAVNAPLTPDAMIAVAAHACIELDTVINAPDMTHTWGQARSIILTALEPGKLPADTVVAIGDTALEREWCAAGRLAGYVSAQSFFGAQPG